MTTKIIMASAQCILGTIAWFYVFAVTFTHSPTVENLAAPFIVAMAGSAISSALWACGPSVPISLPALGFSLAFWGWAIFVGISDFHLSSLIFWGGSAASVHLSGLVGSWIARKWCMKRAS